MTSSADSVSKNGLSGSVCDQAPAGLSPPRSRRLLCSGAESSAFIDSDPGASPAPTCRIEENRQHRRQRGMQLGRCQKTAHKSTRRRAWQKSLPDSRAATAAVAWGLSARSRICSPPSCAAVCASALPAPASFPRSARSRSSYSDLGSPYRSPRQCFAFRGNGAHHRRCICRGSQSVGTHRTVRNPDASTTDRVPATCSASCDV